MGRPIGSRNQGFAERREQIAAAMTDKMRRAAGAKASLRELADAADISVATLRHYFTDREGAIRAAFEFFHRKEEPYLAEARTPTLGDLEGSVRSFLEHVVDGMRNQGLDEMLLNGLEAGVHHDQLGPSFITEVLEPMIQSLEARLEAHMEHGDMARANSRHAALFLLSPVLLALFHQDGLCGAQLRPLDLDAMVREQSERFSRAYRI